VPHSIRLDLTPEHVSKIRSRFAAEGVTGADERPKAGGKDHAVPAPTVDRIVQLAMSPPPAGRSRWTTRSLANEVALTSGLRVRRASEKRPRAAPGADLQSQRDPDFAAKVDDVVGLYLNPPEHAVVLSVDEKTPIQALLPSRGPSPRTPSSSHTAEC
jgi:hypothetical protein